jgi:uncharacterized protein involved in exopolysaccharide biosynthesis/Mrp family chromosome partitioning ATPase
MTSDLNPLNAPSGLPTRPSGTVSVYAVPESPAAYFFSVIRHRAWEIFTAVALVAGATYGISRLITPAYEATATVDIDLRTPVGVLGSDAHQVSSLDGDQFMATQMKLIQSDSVLRAVAQKYNLLKIEKQESGEPDVPETTLKQVPVLLKKLRVNRPPNTFLIEISYRSPDRELSSSVANEIADSYIRHTYNLRYQSAEGLSAFMGKQLEQLKAKMEQSSDKLAAFERDLNVADPEQKTAILSSRLIQLNNEYATAEADRLRKEAAFHSMQNGTMEAAEVSTQGEALKQLTERLSQAKEKFAVVSSQFGKNFPEYKKAAQTVDELQAQLEQARQSVSKRVEIEYHQAASREAMLASTVADLKHEFDALNARTFEYQTLKRDADADKRLYDEIDQKIREAGINAEFQNSSIRIADAARPPLKAVSPNIPLNLLLASCFSLFGAIVVAIAADKRESTIGDADSVPSAFYANVVGSLPFVRNVHGLSAGSQATASSRKLVSLERVMFDEAIQSLRTGLLLAPQNVDLRCLAVMSALPGEGKTLTACHLAIANAQKGRRTLLIDFDLHRPAVSRYLGLDVSDEGNDAPENPASNVRLRRNAAQLTKLDVLTVDTGVNRSPDVGMDELTGTEISKIVAGVRDGYELVIIDSPPILGFSTPLEIAACADGVLLVAVAGETRSKMLGQCVTSLRQIGAKNLSVVLNKVTASNSHGGYYGSYLKRYKRYAS